MKVSPYTILKRPVITEDSMDLSTRPEPQYVFVVNRKSNKIEIARAVESVFGVRVKCVNTLNQDGKVKRRGKASGRTPSKKKAFVTLEKGQKIDLF
jgi:large subunit ribosomal protein L23